MTMQHKNETNLSKWVLKLKKVISPKPAPKLARTTPEIKHKKMNDYAKHDQNQWRYGFQWSWMNQTHQAESNKHGSSQSHNGEAGGSQSNHNPHKNTVRNNQFQHWSTSCRL